MLDVAGESFHVHEAPYGSPVARKSLTAMDLVHAGDIMDMARRGCMNDLEQR